MEEQINEVVNSILEIKNTLATKKERLTQWTPDQLSAAAMKLALLKVTLGTFLADLEIEPENLDAIRKMKEVEIYIKERAKESLSKDAEIIAKSETKDLLLKTIEAKAIAKKIKILHQDITDLITTIQSRLNYLKSEKIEARQQ